MSGRAALEARVAEAVAACRARRPAFAVAAGVAEAAVLALLPAEGGEEALAALRLDDLYLAAACAARDGAALAEFEARVLPEAVRPAARGLHAHEVAELAQAVRRELFAAAPGAAARILRYGGRAPLEVWTRAIALRKAALLRKRPPEELDALEERLAELCAPGDAERAAIRGQLQHEFRASFQEALKSLSPRSRALLRLHAVEGATLEALAAAYGVHRATVARWLALARGQLFKRTRARLAAALQLPNDELDSAIAAARSGLELSLPGLFASDVSAGPAAPAPPRRA